MGFTHYFTRHSSGMIYMRGYVMHLEFKRTTKVKISKDRWNGQVGWPDGSSYEAKQVKQELSLIRDRVQLAWQDHVKVNQGYVDPEAFRSSLHQIIKGYHAEVPGQGLDAYFKNYIAKMSAGTIKSKSGDMLSPATIRAYGWALKLLQKFSKYRDFNFRYTQVTASLIDAVIKENHLKPKSATLFMAVVKVVMEAARKDGLHNVSKESYAYSIRVKKREPLALTEKELKDIHQVTDLSNHNQLALNLFLGSCYTGLRYTDISALIWGHIQDGFIKITQQKTKAEVVIPIHESMVEVLERCSKNDYYVFGKSLHYQSIRKRLADVVEILANRLNSDRIRKVTFHTGRRTFATINYRKGVPASLLMKITGHQSESSFMGYIGIQNREAAEDLKKIWKSEK